MLSSKEKFLEEHLLYEFQMLEYSISGNNTNKNNYILSEYAMLEIFLLHARSLIEFFYHIGKHSEDVDGFVENIETWHERRDKVKFIDHSRIYGRISETLSHLNAKRSDVSGNDKIWDNITYIRNRLGLLLDALLDNAKIDFREDLKKYFDKNLKYADPACSLMIEPIGLRGMSQSYFVESENVKIISFDNIPIDKKSDSN